MMKSKVVAFVVLLLVIGGAFCVVSEPFQIAFCDPGNKPDPDGPPGGGITPCGDPVPGSGPGGDD